MTLKKTGLNDSDKVVVTVALWISMVTVFITALTLPMLPPKVSIFSIVEENAVIPDIPYSKYNNLYLILITLIPTVIMLVASALKRHNRLQNNFMSVMLFSIMLSISISSVMVYGIVQQFNSNTPIQEVNPHGVVTIVIAFVISSFAAVFPTFNHKPSAMDRAKSKSGIVARLAENADRYWLVGAYGYIAVAIIGAFIPGAFAYIPLAAGSVAYLLFLFLFDPYKHSVKTVEDEPAE